MCALLRCFPDIQLDKVAVVWNLTTLIAVLLLAAATQTVKVDQYPLRSGCEQSDPIVTRLHAGDPVRIKFSLAGAAQPCYVVSATVDGKLVDGNLPADALTGLEEFERSRRDAGDVSASVASPPPATNIQIPASTNQSSPEMDRAMQLLQRNQPAEALEILQKFQKLFPNNPELLALCGMAAYKSDNLRLALEYWKQSLDIKTEPQVERAFKAALRESENDKSSEKKFGTRFLLRYEGSVADSDTARAMIVILEEEFSRISFQIGCRSDERIVTIVQGRQAYLKTTGAPDWSGGGYDGKIHIPVLDRAQVSARTRQVFAHELVHACLANIGSWPIWLHEGLAQRLSGEPALPQVREAIKQLAKEGKLPKLAGLGQTWGNKSAAEAQFAYGMARAAVDLFYQYHAEFGVRNLMNNPAALPGITEDLDRQLRE
jgi:tetratricopeptide (TPR) repeat protein